MKMVMRPRYYCDFCKKKGGSAWHIRTHEANCTNNPSRGCRMCAAQGKPQVSLQALVALTRDIPALRKAANGCPACMLAAIRQTKWTQTVIEDNPGLACGWEEIPEHVRNWSFQDEATAFWARVNESEASADYCCY